MIAPKMIGDAALAARLGAIPAALRAVLAGDADRLGRMLRDQVARPAVGERVSVVVDSTANGVTLTVTRRAGFAVQSRHATRPTPGRTWVARRGPRSHRPRPATGAPPGFPGVRAALVAMGPQIGARLATVFRREVTR